GCASEDISVTSKFMCKDGFITTEFIQGDHLSVSLVVGTHTLPITINKQIVDFSDKITYKGGVVPYDTASKDDILDTAIKSAEILGCRGYVGIDIVLGDAPYIVDVNTRATTSIVGIDQVLKGEIADLILKAKFGGLQERVKIDGQVSFEVGELGQ
ncbi:MAG: ATP-grasp domain-containing protein, partial [Halobacteriota archaeon]|nr:ATP-grasp domain-containing protein [Halobacteriota archaeon]